MGVTLEHAYPENGLFVPKLASGKYVVKRHAPNRLPYETFEIQGVPDFQGSPVSGILIHVGNYNKDSEGCVLLGLHLGVGCILESKIAFEQFMETQSGLDEFNLEVL